MSEIQLETRTAQPYASIRTQATLAEWGDVNALVGEVAGWLVERGVPMTGPPVYRYWRTGDNEVPFDLEVGWLTAHPVEGDDRVCNGEIPAGTYIVATHIGHPDDLPETFDAMMEWADSQNVLPATRLDGETVVWGGWFELFMTNPAEEPDLNRWRIDVLQLTRGTEQS